MTPNEQRTRQRYSRRAKKMDYVELKKDIDDAVNYIYANKWDIADLSVQSWLLTLEYASRELNKRLFHANR